MAGKYITAHTIGAKLARNHKGLDFDIYDIVEWCAEAERNIGEFASFIEYKDVCVIVKNRRAVLPCGVYRLLWVKNNGNAFKNYTNDGAFINFNEDLTNLTIDYIGIPLDAETGFPLILEGHEEACYFYCLTRLYMEDFLSNKMSAQAYKFLDDKYVIYSQKAKSSMRYTSRDELDEIQMIIHNWIPSVRMPKNI